MTTEHKFEKGDRVRTTVAIEVPPIRKGQHFTVLKMSEDGSAAFCLRDFADGGGKTFIRCEYLEKIER